MLPSKLPSTLTSLPEDVLVEIALLLDTPSALSLARVAKACTPPASHKIWQHLHLYKSLDFGQLYMPYGGPDGEQAQSAEWREKVLAHKKHELEVWEKVLTVQGQGHEGAWGLTKSISMMPRPGSTDGMVRLLRQASATLSSLEVLSTSSEPPIPYSMSELHLNPYEWVDTAMLRCNAHWAFPSLTHVHIGTDLLQHVGFIPFLCQHAPELVSLDFAIDDQPTKRPYALRSTPPSPFPTLFARPTKLRQLRVVYTEDEDGPPLASSLESVGIIVSLIESSPELRELAVWYPEPGRKDIVRRFVTAISQMKNLRDLHWPQIGEYEIRRWISGLPRIPNVRRVVSAWNDWTLPYETGLDFSVAEILYLNGADRHDSFSAYGDIPSPRIPEDFARLLRRTPRLREMYYMAAINDIHNVKLFSGLDGIDRDGNLTGVFRSLRHGEEELLHARLRLQDVMIVDSKFHEPDGRVQLLYVSGSGLGPDHEFEGWRDEGHQRSAPRWVDFTDLDGVAIPMEVIERMMEVEGERDWDQRGVEVGDGAWKVITDWLGYE